MNLIFDGWNSPKFSQKFLDFTQRESIKRLRTTSSASSATINLSPTKMPLNLKLRNRKATPYHNSSTSAFNSSSTSVEPGTPHQQSPPPHHSTPQTQTPKKLFSSSSSTDSEAEAEVPAASAKTGGRKKK
jgi:hypothetical protein